MEVHKETVGKNKRISGEEIAHPEGKKGKKKATTQKEKFYKSQTVTQALMYSASKF